jgi:hypothetical protein
MGKEKVSWSGGLIDWLEGDTAYISVVFSWKVPDAYQRSVWYKQQGYKVRVGGPGVYGNRKYLSGLADLSGEVDALIHHNPNATMASRGCPVGCYFCIVPKMEGKTFTLLPDFTPRPILCDNNLSALDGEYQDYIVEKYKKYDVPLLDAISGFEPRTFFRGTYLRWKAINRGAWRFGYDETSEEEYVYRMIQILKDEPPGKKRIYVLIGNESFEYCFRRIMQVIEWGCEPHVQPMMALNTLQKRPIIRFDWTEKKLRDLARWSNRWIWRTVPFSEYKSSYK